MTARKQVESLDDGAYERAPAIGGWKLIVTEADEIDEIAERDARQVSEKVRRVLSSEAGSAR